MTAKPYHLAALGRLAASTRDEMGDTLGSFSAMALEPGSWRVTERGCAGVFLTLGDRGFNIPEQGKFSDYPARVHRIAFELVDAQLRLKLLGARYVRDEKGASTTGLDPGFGTTKQFGAVVPSPEQGPAAGRLSLDCEGLAIKADGSFFISDEFGPNIYACAADGQMTGVITPPEAFVPYGDGRLCFASRGAKPDRGRSPNDGFEGLGLSSDGKTLFALLQSPLVQDRQGKKTSRRYTRILAYDVAGKTLPREPTQHYVVELPLHGEEIGGEMTEAAEANEIVSTGADRILVLTRESFGVGAKERHSRRPIVHKQVMIGSLTDATDISGSKYERAAVSIMDGDKLDDAIIPVRLQTFVDIADEAELNRVGLTARAGQSRYQLLSAKWESLVLSPALDASRPNERLLFVGNDNDFRTRSGFMPDGPYDGEFEHDNLVLAYRVTLPS